MRSWLAKFVLGFGTISRLLPAAPEPVAKPAIALIDPNDAEQWQAWTKAVGWQLIVPRIPAKAAMDPRVQAVEAAVNEAIQAGSADASRIYLAGRGETSAAVFYAISRLPDLWAGAAALGGSPQPAIDSSRLYAANFSHVPVLWVSPDAQDQALATKLKDAGLNLEWRNAQSFSVHSLFEILAGYTRPDNPARIDCETNSPSFAHCYWVRMTKFDAGERNEVLPSSHIQPETIPALDLGGFGYRPDDAGPGVAVSFLPEKYSGPLKMGDRLVALDGRPIADAREFHDLLAAAKQERPATVMVQRGKERVRLETAITMPKPTAPVTARVQAEFDSMTKEIRIVSRAVTEMRVTIPAPWTPLLLRWNGVPVTVVDVPGCRLLRIDQELETAAPCP
ncbi:MAG: hypothetical protein JO323_01735 [Acidobacteriia bacterium]|nr:hypothetical protein [Terriglobia bacterium]